jgi:hypothetical protein
MSDPKRLLVVSDSALACALLRAGREEIPDEALTDRALRAVAAGTVLSLTTTAAAASSASAAGSAAGVATAGGASGSSAGVLGVIAKWIGVASVGGTLAVGAVVGTGVIDSATLRDSWEIPASSVAVRAAASSAPSAHGPGTSETITKALEEPASDPPEPDPASRTPDLTAPSADRRGPRGSRRPANLLDEVAALDRIRAALQQGDANAAAADLSRYESQFENPRLKQEALVLRMEALDKQGNVEAAQAVARQLLSDFPTGPHAEAARAVLVRRP